MRVWSCRTTVLAGWAPDSSWWLDLDYVCVDDDSATRWTRHGDLWRTVSSSDDERRHALELLVGKYAPDYAAVGEKYIDKSFHRTAVIAIDAEWWSGKTKRV